MNYERGPHGSKKYLSQLTGDLDGCRLEVEYLPDEQLMTLEICDDTSLSPTHKMRIAVEEKQTELGDEYLKMQILSSERFAEDIEEVELLNLGAWFLAESTKPIVLIGNGSVHELGQPIHENVASVIGESKMDQFYSGEVVALRDGLSVQVRVTETKTSGLMEVETTVVKNTITAAKMRSFLYDDNSRNVVEVESWLNMDDDYNHLGDLMAFQMRFLMNNYRGEFDIRYQDREVTIKDEEVFKLTYFWLGF